VQFHLNAMDCQAVVLEPKGTKQAEQAEQAEEAEEARQARQARVDCVMTDHADWSNLVSGWPQAQRLQSLPRIQIKSDGLPIQLTPQVSPAASDQVIQPTLMFAPFSRTELRLALSQAFRLEAHGESAAVVSNALSTHEHWGKDLAGLRVLLVEDNATLSLVYQALLASMGCVSESADNGQQALALVRHSAFDLVLMDCHLPELDGFEATKAIRRWELDLGVKTRLPIIALTASDALEDPVKSIASGMDGFCAKPLTRAQLLAAIQKACSAHGPSTPLKR
jgi:CheY-like chemotaxis protein